MRSRTHFLNLLAALVLIGANAYLPNALAVTADGTMTLTLNNSVLDTLKNTDNEPNCWAVEEFFDSNYLGHVNRTQPDFYPGNVEAPSPLVMTFNINGSSVWVNGETRHIKATTWDSVSNPGGVIGTTGVIRFGCYGVPGSTWSNTYLRMGDLTLVKENNTWYIHSHDPNFPDYTSFEIINAAEGESNGKLTLSGDVIFGDQSDWAGDLFWHLGQEDLHKVIGTIQLTPDTGSSSNNPEAQFDSTSLIATLPDVIFQPDVDFQNLHYKAELKLVGDTLVLNGTPQPTTQYAKAPVILKSDMALIVPKLKWDNRYWRVELTHLGNLSFGIKKLTEVK